MSNIVSYCAYCGEEVPRGTTHKCVDWRSECAKLRAEVEGLAEERDEWARRSTRWATELDGPNGNDGLRAKVERLEDALQTTTFYLRGVRIAYLLPDEVRVHLARAVLLAEEALARKES